MGQPDRDVAEILVEFTRRLSDGQSVEAVFAALGEYCTDLLGAAGTGILLLEEGDLVVATTNSELGDAAERLEAELGEGPCADSVRTSEAVAVPDLEAAADRWPNFAPKALAAGVRGIHALPMGGRGDHAIGALNIVTAEARELTEQQLRIADMLADVAVSFLVTTRAHEQANELAGQLQRALDSRVVIEQAKGILAGRHEISLADAFDRIRRHARSGNRRVQDVSRDVCEGRLDL